MNLKVEGFQDESFPPGRKSIITFREIISPGERKFRFSRREDSNKMMKIERDYSPGEDFFTLKKYFRITGGDLMIPP